MSCGDWLTRIGADQLTPPSADLLKAMLVPLGGAGGAQLFDYLLLGR